jgi:MYXO-CTERM domain-containing protein
MNKLSRIAAVVALGTACALPVMAQDTSTQSTSSPDTQATTTQSMGAGPETMDRQDNGRDMGWIGLLGLAGLLGLRRKHDHHDNVDTRRTTTAR